MNTLSNVDVSEPEPWSVDPDQAAFRDEVLHHLAGLPFDTDGKISRTLWLIYVAPWRQTWTKAVLPLDDSLDVPDRKDIEGWCDLMALFLKRPAVYDGEALVALRRPGTMRAGISEADEYIFRALCEATARRDTVPWAFYVTGPDGVWEVTEFVQRGRKAFSLVRT
ncbi:MAG: hypothetical protein JO345_21400 [Streptosporangiaceae bacterium]|nr:hypothetical protein [Streptosporangiaceae bacterium]